MIWIKSGIMKQHEKRDITLEDWQELPTNWNDHDIKPGENTASDISGPHLKSLGGAHYTITLVCRRYGPNDEKEVGCPRADQSYDRGDARDLQ